MNRAAHKLDARGQCRRCGLSRGTARQCPPGFWMTAYEAKTWDGLSAPERVTFERWCLGGGSATLQSERKP